MHPKIPKNLIKINASKSYLKLTTRNFPNDENSQWVKTFKKNQKENYVITLTKREKHTVNKIKTRQISSTIKRINKNH